ncbi:hypothetical protein TWF694_005828 [Orbilia ellipsospora]|uniref:Uncharacterized protein n=1 Tax=Orbilia ellipsospora TaxID=2528407 RepID=A0AAV9WS51_9PEZI
MGKRVQRTPEGKVSKTSDKDTKRQSFNGANSFIESVKEYLDKPPNKTTVSMRKSDESIGRRIVQFGVPAPGTEQNYVQEIWEAINPNSTAAHIWKRNLDSAIEYLSTTTLVWRALHLSLLNGAETVSVIYEPGGYFTGSKEDDEVTKELRLRYYACDIFPNLEFVEAKVSKGAVHAERQYDENRCPGRSIGVGGILWSAGSVGGFLTTPEKDKFFGLSCHHVLLPTKPAETAEREKKDEKEPWEFSAPEFLDVQGVHQGPYDTNEAEVIIVQPACGDHRDNLRRAQEMKVQYENLLSDLFEKHEFFGTTPPKADVDKLRFYLRNVEESLAAYSSFNREFGKLCYTSGYRIDPTTDHTLDWGLFQLSEDAQAFNAILTTDAAPSWGKLAESPVPITGIAEPAEMQEAFKLGRKTGGTFGVISGVQDGVRLKEHDRDSREWCIISKSKTPFILNGDSGSLVLNQALQVVGIVTSGCDIRNCTYFTPIKLVLQDIKDRTGLDLQFI